MPQSLAQVWLHLVFSTKDRRPFLQDETFREEMFRMLSHHVKESNCVNASVGGHIDHVHLLVGLALARINAQLLSLQTCRESGVAAQCRTKPSTTECVELYWLLGSALRTTLTLQDDQLRRG